MSRRVQIIVICEDTQHEAFLRRFFEEIRRSWRLRVQRAPKGKGSAEQFVRERFAGELREHRRRRVARVLVVMIDGDAEGVRRRLKYLDDACSEANIPPRMVNEGVAVFVPTWNIETWLAYLGGETVDESRPDYPRLPKESGCDTQVDALVEMCRSRELRRPAPRSLVAACREYRRLEEKSRD